MATAFFLHFSSTFSTYFSTKFAVILRIVIIATYKIIYEDAMKTNILWECWYVYTKINWSFANRTLHCTYKRLSKISPIFYFELPKCDDMFKMQTNITQLYFIIFRCTHKSSFQIFKAPRRRRKANNRGKRKMDLGVRNPCVSTAKYSSHYLSSKYFMCPPEACLTGGTKAI